MTFSHSEQIRLLALLSAPIPFEVEDSSIRLRVALAENAAAPSTESWADRVLDKIQSPSNTWRDDLARFSRAAHDLKNLLLAVDNHRATARNSASKYHHMAQAEATLERARAAASGLAQLLNLVPVQEFQEFALDQLLRRFASRLHELVPNAIALRIAQDSSTATVYGDEALLLSALENLAKNAVEAMQGRGALSLEWTHVASTNTVLIEMSDNGPGVPREVLGALSNDQRAPTHKAEGHGLGLLSVASVARLHGGSFRMSNRERGAVAQLSIPARPIQINASDVGSGAVVAVVPS